MISSLFKQGHLILLYPLIWVLVLVTPVTAVSNWGSAKGRDTSIPHAQDFPTGTWLEVEDNTGSCPGC